MSILNIPKYPTTPVFLSGIREVFKGLEYASPRMYVNQSRYTNIRTIIDEHRKIPYHESYNRFTVAKSEDDRYYTVTEVTTNRLDLISSHYYGTPSFWWVIADANNIIDPLEDVLPDMILRIPTLTSLYADGGVFSR